MDDLFFRLVLAKCQATYEKALDNHSKMPFVTVSVEAQANQ